MKRLLFILLVVVTSCHKVPKAVENSHNMEAQREMHSVPNSYAHDVHSIFYKSTATKIEDEGQKALKKLIEELKNMRDVKVVLYGYSDKVGTKDENKELAEKRVAVVKKELQKSGVIKANNIEIETKVFGEHDPLVSYDTIDNNPHSRRVDIFISEKN